MPIINHNNIPVIKLDECGEPIRCHLFTDQQWAKFIKRGEAIRKYGREYWTWQKILDEKMIMLPQVKVKRERNGRAKNILKHDVLRVIEEYKKRKIMHPYTTALANDLGIERSVFYDMNRKYWHIELPHSRKKKS